MSFLLCLSYVHIFKDSKSVHRDYKLWQSNEYPVLFITGLAGSGKTHFANRLAVKYSAVLLSLDSLKYYKEASGENRKLVDEFISVYPEIKPFVAKKWMSFSKNNSINELYTKYSGLFMNYIIQKALKNHKKYIIEGIHIFVRLPFSMTEDSPLVILRTSYVHSILRKIKREYLSKDNEYRKHYLREIFYDLFVYEFQQLIRLNKYISYQKRVSNKNTLVSSNNS